MKRQLFVLSLLFICFPVSAGSSDAILDSLYANLKSAKDKPGNALAEAYSDIGDFYLYKQPDSSYFYFQKGIDHLRDKTDICYPGLLNNMATYYFSIGELDKALSSFLFARKESMRLGHDEISTVISSSLGIIYRRKEMPDSALYYYDEALKIAERQDDDAAVANLYANIAVLYGATNRLEEALPYSQKAVEYSLKGNDPVQVVYARTIYGAFLIKKEAWNQAAPVLRKGLSESIEMKSSQLVIKCITPLLSIFDHWGQRDSVRYYMEMAEKELSAVPPASIEVLGYYETKGKLLSRYGQYRESLEALKKVENMRGKNLQTPSDLLYFNFAANYYGLKDYVSAYEYMKKAYLDKDSLFAGEVQKQLSDLTVKYQTKEKELEISRLKQIQTEQHALMVRRIFYLVLGLLVLIAAFLILLYKKKALEKETDLRLARQYIDGLESERKRLAKELHDGVCNDLLGIQYSMQASEAVGSDAKQMLFPMIEQARTDIRFISHELMPPKLQYANLNVMLEDYVERFAHMYRQIRFHYSSLPVQADWTAIPGQKAYELYRIVQEVLSNSVTHSKATEIEITLSLSEQQHKATLVIRDNGKGISAAPAVAEGIGLRTVEDRVKCMEGTYSLTSDENGTSFTLEVSFS